MDRYLPPQLVASVQSVNVPTVDRSHRAHSQSVHSPNVSMYVISISAGKLAALEEFRVQKEKLMAHVGSLEEQLERQKQEHLTIIYNLERKAVLDNDR